MLYMLLLLNFSLYIGISTRKIDMKFSNFRKVCNCLCYTLAMNCYKLQKLHRYYPVTSLEFKNNASEIKWNMCLYSSIRPIQKPICNWGFQHK